MNLDAVEILKQLVAIPSVNPMDHQVDDAIFGEARLTDFLEETFSRLGLTVFRQPVLPGRENLIARLDGEDNDRLLLLDAHQDTVSVEGMTIQPFMPLERDGKLFGRGACDVKGGMAAIIAAVSQLANHRPRPTIVVACTVNEEYGFSGVSRLVQLWEKNDGDIIPRRPDAAPCATAGSSSSASEKPPENIAGQASSGTLLQHSIFPRRPDAALIVEPTGLDVVVAHKGVVRWRCHTQGRAGHSSHPVAEDNAIYRMARVVSEIERFAGKLESDGPAHPLCGRRTLSVGTIHGGTSPNIMPERCTIAIDCRLPPGDSPKDARQELIDRLSQPATTTFPLVHDMAFISGPPLSDDDNGQLADRLSRSAVETTGGGGRLGVPYATNAAFYAEAGVPSVVFGPGSIEQAHTADEWISLEQLCQGTEIIERFCRSFS